ncbi:MAG: NRAMP family divalent metal transporter, partial [Candidatus Saccharimonadales bacterium]
ATVLIVHEPWGEILRSTFLPHIDFTVGFFFIISGVIGTTISPYMVIWQASEDIEDERLRHLGKNLDGKPKIRWRDVWAMRFDTALGMIFSNIVMWSIMVTAATVLFSHGITDVRTSADAAKALEPLVVTFPNAGFMAKLLFSLGIIGLWFLTVPVLSSSASYAVAEAMNWRASLSYKLKRAHGFYGVITIATFIGLLINIIGIDPIRALIITAVFNGIVSVPLLLLIALLAADKKVMGEYKSGWLSCLFVWLAFLFVLASVLALLISWLFSLYGK